MPSAFFPPPAAAGAGGGKRPNEPLRPTVTQYPRMLESTAPGARVSAAATAATRASGGAPPMPPPPPRPPPFVAATTPATTTTTTRDWTPPASRAHLWDRTAAGPTVRLDLAELLPPARLSLGPGAPAALASGRPLAAAAVLVGGVAGRRLEVVVEDSRNLSSKPAPAGVDVLDVVSVGGGGEGAVAGEDEHAAAAALKAVLRARLARCRPASASDLLALGVLPHGGVLAAAPRGSLAFTPLLPKRLHCGGGPVSLPRGPSGWLSVSAGRALVPLAADDPDAVSSLPLVGVWVRLDGAPQQTDDPRRLPLRALAAAVRYARSGGGGGGGSLPRGRLFVPGRGEEGDPQAGQSFLLLVAWGRGEDEGFETRCYEVEVGVGGEVGGGARCSCGGGNENGNDNDPLLPLEVYSAAVTAGGDVGAWSRRRDACACGAAAAALSPSSLAPLLLPPPPPLPAALRRLLREEEGEEDAAKDNADDPEKEDELQLERALSRASERLRSCLRAAERASAAVEGEREAAVRCVEEAAAAAGDAGGGGVGSAGWEDDDDEAMAYVAASTALRRSLASSAATTEEVAAAKAEAEAPAPAPSPPPSFSHRALMVRLSACSSNDHDDEAGDGVGASSSSSCDCVCGRCCCRQRATKAPALSPPPPLRPPTSAAAPPSPDNDPHRTAADALLSAVAADLASAGAALERGGSPDGALGRAEQSLRSAAAVVAAEAAQAAAAAEQQQQQQPPASNPMLLRPPEACPSPDTKAVLRARLSAAALHSPASLPLLWGGALPSSSPRRSAPVQQLRLQAVRHSAAAGWPPLGFGASSPRPCCTPLAASPPCSPSPQARAAAPPADGDATLRRSAHWRPRRQEEDSEEDAEEEDEGKGRAASLRRQLRDLRSELAALRAEVAAAATSSSGGRRGRGGGRASVAAAPAMMDGPPRVVRALSPDAAVEDASMRASTLSDTDDDLEARLARKYGVKRW